MYRNAVFSYNNEDVNIRLVTGLGGIDMFLLECLGRIIGYFEPIN